MYWLHTQSQFRLGLVSVLPDDSTSQGALQTALVIFVSFSIALTSVSQMAIHQLVVLFEFQKKDEKKNAATTLNLLGSIPQQVSRLRLNQGKGVKTLNNC